MKNCHLCELVLRNKIRKTVEFSPFISRDLSTRGEKTKALMMPPFLIMKLI